MLPGFVNARIFYSAEDWKQLSTNNCFGATNNPAWKQDWQRFADI